MFNFRLSITSPETADLKQLQFKITSLQENIKIIETNLMNELKIFSENLYKKYNFFINFLGIKILQKFFPKYH